MVTRAGFDSAFLMSYEDGPSGEEFFTLYRHGLANIAEQQRDFAQTMQLAIGSVFDGKVFSRYSQTVTREVNKLRDSTKPDGVRQEQQMQRSRQELNKLRGLLG